MPDTSNPSFLLTSPHNATITPLPAPVPQSPTDLLLRITHTGICGSDLHYLLHGRIGPFVLTTPITLGHESSAVVISGPLPPGTRVALEPGLPCRVCAYCKSGRYNLCRAMRFAATPPHHGTLCKFFVLPRDMCVVLPDGVSSEEGALLEPTAVAVHVTRLAGVEPGESVVVFGAGPVGALCAAVARARGAGEVVVVDVVAARLEVVRGVVVRGCGVFNSRGVEDVAGEVKARFGLGEGAHRVVDATGAGACIKAGIEVLRPGGTFVQAGMGSPEVSFPIVEVAAKELVVKGSFRYAAGDYEEALRLVKEGKVRPGMLVSHRFKFEQCAEAFEVVRKGEGVKVIIEGPE